MEAYKLVYEKGGRIYGSRDGRAKEGDDLLLDMKVVEMAAENGGELTLEANGLFDVSGVSKVIVKIAKGGE